MNNRSTVTKKKYRPKDGNNESMSVISLNESVNLTNTTFVSVLPEASNQRVEVQDLSSYIETSGESPKTYKFEYSFNEYLRLFLNKVLPLKEQDMEIIAEEKTLRGPQAKCEKLLKKIKNELERFAMKIVKYNEDADIEEIEYHLEEKYTLKIYKRKFLALASKDVVERYGFKEQAEKFLKRINREQIILVRVDKSLEVECINQIRMLITGDTNSSTIQPQNSQVKQKRQERQERQPQGSSSEEIVEDEDEPTYYHSQKTHIKDVSKSDFRPFTSANFKKMEEPTEDDSISVVEEKRRKKQQQENPRYKERDERRYRQEGNREEEKRWEEEGGQRNKQEQKLKLIKEYEYEDFDEKGFRSWLKNIRSLSERLVKVVSKEDPYDSTIFTHGVQLFCEKGDQRRESELLEALEHYLKFRKVVMVKLQNDKYREQLVQKYTQDSEPLTVRFIKGFKSPKWGEPQMWKHIVNNTYTETKKHANTEPFQLFFLEGLKNLVQETEKQIRDSLENEPKEDEMEELIIKFAPEIADCLRNNKRLQDLIKEYAQKLMSANYKHCCELLSVQFLLSNLKLSLKVKNDQLDQFEKTVSPQIQEKVQSEIKISEFTAPSQIDKHTYAELEKVAVIISKEEKSFKYVSSIFSMGDLIQKMNNILNVQNRIAEKELAVLDKIIAKKLGDHLLELIAKKGEYTEIKHNYVSDQSKYKFYGREYHLRTLLQELQEYIAETEEKRINYYQLAKCRLGDLLEKDTIIRDISSKHDISICVNRTELPCKITLTNSSELFKKKSIMVVKSKSLDYAPCGSVIAFRSLAEADLFKGNYFLKTFRNYINKHKTEKFDENTRKYTILIKQSLGVAETLREALNISGNLPNHVILIMPEQGKEAFVKSIIKELLENKKLEEREVTVMIIEYGLGTDLLQQLKISPYVKGKKLQLKDERVRKYYVEDKNQKFYYSDSGNRKILTAYEKGFSKVILNNDDLNIMHISHAFITQSLTIIHLQSTKQFKITVNNTKVEFALKDQTYEVPQDQATNILNAIRANTAKLDISLGVYQIDLTAMTQTNLFSGFQRKLCFEDTIIKADINQEQVQALYNIKIAEIQYSYCFEDDVLDSFNTALECVASFLQDHIKQKEISYKQLKNIEAADLEGIKTAIEEDEETQCLYNTLRKTISLKTLDEASLNRCEQMINMILKNLNERDPHKIQFPAIWEPQKEDIETFEVIKGSPEFALVQQKFTLSPIKSLHRIQNKIIYKKYFEQGAFLESLNGGKKVKTMQLFHGTRTTNPEEIYRDKEESFNINYSSDNNLLGKGIYFAEKSEYSNNYRYSEVVSQGKIFGLGASYLHSMFLCEVLVGESQKCLQHNGAIKDTAYRDPTNKIKFESMTDFLNNSNIFVVYKSRRAYPLYLIKY